jgi:hypothetical protein
MDWLAWLNPLTYLSEQEYLSWWNAVAERYLVGVPLRLLTIAFLSGCYWSGVYRQRVGLAVFFFLLALVSAYLHPLMHVIGLV